MQLPAETPEYLALLRRLSVQGKRRMRQWRKENQSRRNQKNARQPRRPLSPYADALSRVLHGVVVTVGDDEQNPLDWRAQRAFTRTPMWDAVISETGVESAVSYMQWIEVSVNYGRN